ncbi:MAG: cupin domain-containing protein [Aigarchaeota archaeon]|nr:cupin domain-containing protein [Candidatus Calditenuaceae archaeon]
MQVVRSSASVVEEPVERAEGAFIQWLVDRRDGAPNFELRKFRMKPGGKIPPHMHPEIEHVQYVLKGRYRVRLGEKEVVVKAGDALLIPPRTAHAYYNDGEEDAEFLCIIPLRSEYKTVWLDEQPPRSC